MLDDQREASLVSLHTGAHDALYLGKKLDILLVTQKLFFRAVFYQFRKINRRFSDLASDKFCALRQHRMGAPVEAEVHRIGGNAKIQVRALLSSALPRSSPLLPPS